ncbi:MAG: replicative DNA helicase [Thermodesulfobacteriota bacterium]|nr:MAG: replicative DNA helicase [Thermodesulfobacteriota bacterium]
MKQENIQKNIVNQSYPNNIEAEQAVLGAILIDRSKIKDIVQIISSSDFYNESHVKIFDAMIDLNNKNIPIDLLTLFDYLKSKGNLLKEVGESSYLTYLTELVPTSQNATYYAELVKIKADERHLCEVFTSLDHRLRSGSISSEQAGEQVMKAISRNRSSSDLHIELSPWHELVGSQEPEIEFLIADLIPTSCLLILAGKPKLGKSLLALLFAISIGLGETIWDKKVIKGGVLFVSTEDGVVRLNKRIWKMLGNPDKYEPDFHFHIGECILTDFKVLEALTTKILEYKPRLVVLDPLINLIRGRDLNSGEDMNVVLRPLQNICKQTGTTILVIQTYWKRITHGSMIAICFRFTIFL